MSTGMRKWMEKGCPDIPTTPAEVSIDREELRQLRDELTQYKNERDALRAENETLAANLRGKHSTAGATYAHLIAERDALRAALRHEADCVEAAKAEIEALRAKIARMEKQEPARLVTPTAYRWRYRGAIKWQYGELTEEVARLAKEHNHEVRPLYATHGATGGQAMTSEEINALAFQCRVWIPLASGPEREQTIDRLRRFAELVAAAERDACAQIVELNAAAFRPHSELHDVLSANAAAIRARGDA